MTRVIPVLVVSDGRGRLIEDLALPRPWRALVTLLDEPLKEALMHRAPANPHPPRAGAAAAGRLLQLAWVSAAARLMSQEELTRLLAQARRRNQELGVAAVLLLRGSSLFQVLEGAPQTVLQLFEDIRRDARHRDVTEVMRREVATRHLGDAGLEFINLAGPALNRLPSVRSLMRSRGTFLDLIADRACVPRLVAELAREDVAARDPALG